MSRIVRHEFMGSWLMFWLLAISIIGLPLAVLYLIDGTVRIESDVEDAEAFVSAFRAGKK